jgi:hypothetical protein
MVVKSTEMAVEATVSMEMAPGALPRPDKVPEQRLLSPEICLRWRRRCRTLLGKTPIDLGFFVRWLYIGEEAALEVDHGHHTIGPRGPRGGRATLGCGCPLAPSGSRSFFVLHPGKIGVSVYVLSNSENITCVAFLKHKNSKKLGTSTVASYQ